MILNIISIILSSIALFIAVKNSHELKREIPTDEKDTTNKPEFNLDKKLNSLEFNIHLDEIIKPLLTGEYTNKQIIDTITKTIVIDLGITDKSDINKIETYISDLLLLYNYHVEEEPKNKIEEYFEVSNTPNKIDNDVYNALKDFYK